MQQLTVVAGTVEKVSATSRVQVEEDTWHNDDFLLQASLEKVQAIGNGARETLQVEPKVESAVRHIFDHEAHVTKALDDVVSLLLHYVN